VTPVADPFAVVRATSQAAFAAGQGFLDRGDLGQACPLIDTAKTTDPDNRPEIEQALERCLTAIAAATPAIPPTPAPRTIVVATLPVVALGTGAGQTPAPSAAIAVATPSAAAAIGTIASGPLVAWRDPQGRFSVSAPPDWNVVPQPVALFGTGVAQFRDPTRRAELNVAVDSAAKAVSPELYAATMEIAMQQQVPGYASEQFVPGSAAGQPSVRRVFTFTQRDAAANEIQARSFQVTVLKGSTPYIISGSAPAEQFQQYVPTFDQMVETFRFS
jgi:hypothetical protein